MVLEGPRPKKLPLLASQMVLEGPRSKRLLYMMKLMLLGLACLHFVDKTDKAFTIALRISNENLVGSLPCKQC